MIGEWMDLETVDRTLEAFGGEEGGNKDDLGPVPEWLQDPKSSALSLNDDLMRGLFWFEDLPPVRKNECLREMLSRCSDIAAGSRELWWPVVSACWGSGASDARTLCQEWSRSAPDRYKSDADFRQAWDNPGASFTIGTLIKLAKERGFDPEPWRTAEEPAAFAPRRTSSHRASDLFASTAPYKRRLEFGDLLTIGDVTGIGGYGASGKSTLSVSMALSLASGVDLMGFKIYRRRRVLLISFEEEIGEFLNKLQAAWDLHSKARQLPADTMDWITVYGVGDLPGLSLTKQVQGGEEIDRAGFKILESAILEAGAQVIVLDPAARLFPVGANIQGVIYSAMVELKMLAARLSAAVVIVTHTKKGANHTAEGVEAADGINGSVAFVNACRRVLMVRHVDAKECQALGVAYGDEKNLREIVDAKNNYSPAADRRYFLIESVQLNNACPPDYPEGDWVGVAARFTPNPAGRQLPLGALEAALRMLARGAKGGIEPYSPASQSRTKNGKAGRFYADDVAKALAPYLGAAPPAKLQQAAKEAYEHCFGQGWVEVVKLPVGSNQRDGIQVRWTATPWASQPPPGGRYVV